MRKGRLWVPLYYCCEANTGTLLPGVNPYSTFTDTWLNSVPDGKICKNASGELAVTKFAVEPAWYLPGVAERFGIGECTDESMRPYFLAC